LAHRPSVKDPLPGSGAWYVLTQLDDSGSDAELEERLEAAIGEGYNAVIAKNASEAKALWGIRETIPEAQFTNVKHDVSVPISKTPDLIERAERELRAAWPEVRMFAFGHVGDGNIHLNVGPETLVAQREAINRIVYDVVAGLGGSISAEHGLGQLKRGEILRHKDPVELDLMRSLKRALDPRGLMNPGKVI
jgi:FAD/FMN-containing dehydrogenase